VLEGQARGGVPQGRDAHLRTVHAPKDGDAAIVQAVRDAVERGDQVVAVTADRGLSMRVEGAGARVMSPTWLMDLVGY
jgi:inactivated superfamily I helicase